MGVLVELLGKGKGSRQGKEEGGVDRSVVEERSEE